MILSSILIGLGLGFFVGNLEQIRNYSWFERLIQRLEIHWNKYSFWPGPLGALLTLAIPLLLLLVVNNSLNSVSIFLSLLLGVFILVYTLGPDFNNLLNSHLEAIEENNEQGIREVEKILNVDGDSEGEDETGIIQSIIVRTHEQLFGVIFWFIVLGAMGALLYSLVVRMKIKFAGVHGGYADAVRNLHRVLTWPSARLLVLGFAIGGSLVDALEAWQDAEGVSLDNSEDLIGSCGLAAIQYQYPDPDELEERTEPSIENIQDVQALLNRTLIVWLTVLGIMTLSGWLH